MEYLENKHVCDPDLAYLDDEHVMVLAWLCRDVPWFICIIHLDYRITGNLMMNKYHDRDLIMI